MKKKLSKKSLVLRIAAGVLGAAIIVLCIDVTMSFTGNPVSMLLAKNAAVKYVNEKYSEHDLEVQRVYYNFKFGEYGVEMQDKNSMDVNFTVNYKNSDTPLTDDYGYMVTERGRTLARIEEEAGEEIKPYMQAFAQENSIELYDGARCFVYFTTVVEQDEIPPLNTPFSKELGLKGEVFVDFKSDSDMDTKRIADITEGVYTTLVDEGYAVVKVSVHIEMPSRKISVSAEEKFINDDLAENIEKLMNDDDAFIEGMYVFVEDDIVTQDTQSK